MIGLDDVLAGTGGALYRPLAGAVPLAGVVGPEGRPAGLAFRAVGIDSRTIGDGDLFVAVRGETHDGHRFVPDAVARGAAGAVVARGRAAEFGALDPAVPLIEVTDTLGALGALAAHWRGKFAPAGGLRVVGITGSVGKSSTKELAAAVLGTRLRVLKSPKSYNNEFGLPLSVLMIGPETDVAVLEMGVHVPGELTALCAIARPTIGVVTNVGHSHLERMGSQAVIAAAKGELIAALPPDGTAILNGDDPLVRPMAALTGARTLTYGLGAACDLRATDVQSHGLEGLTFTIEYGGGGRTVERVPLLGLHNVYTALAATAIGLSVGLTLDAIADDGGLRDPHTPLRLAVLRGRGGSTIIDDSYNASPVSMLAALAVLAEAPARRRVAVLGDMLELGPYEGEGHRLVGRRVAGVADLLLTIGPRARLIAEGALGAGLPASAVHRLGCKDEALALLERDLREGDLVLIKGSRGLALERVVAALAVQEPS